MACSSSSASCGLALACFVLLATAAGATQYKVGGDNGWAVRDAAAESFNTWAEKTTFQIGDVLLFVYPKGKDSVLLVEPADYNACNVSSFDKQFDDGSTTVALDRAGAFFFISGVEANCRANEKLIVMVTAAAAGASAPGPAGSGGGGSSPSPSTSAPAPSNGGGGGGAPVTPSSSPKAAKNSTAAAAKGGDRNGAPGAGIAAAAGFVAASAAGCVAYATLAF